VEVKLTMAEFQAVCDRWVEAVYHQDPHKGLDGMTPVAKARSWTEPIRKISDVRALDILLYPAPSNDGFRVIGKKGIEVTFGGVKLRFKSGAFAGHEGERCRVLIDETDLGSAPIFLENGEFLCIGEDPGFYGISNREIALHAKREQKRILAEQKAEVKRIAKKADTRNIAFEVLKAREEEAAKVAELPKKGEAYTTPALEQAAVAVAEMDRKTAEPRGTKLTEDQLRKSEELLNRKPLERPKTMLDISLEYERKIKAGTATQEEIEYVEAYRIYEDTGKRTGPLQLRSAG
jgi:hypothetical protein